MLSAGVILPPGLIRRDSMLSNLLNMKNIRINEIAASGIYPTVHRNVVADNCIVDPFF